MQKCKWDDTKGKEIGGRTQQGLKIIEIKYH